MDEEEDGPEQVEDVQHPQRDHRVGRLEVLVRVLVLLEAGRAQRVVAQSLQHPQRQEEQRYEE